MPKKRDKVAHEYFGIDESILWETIKQDIPLLHKEILKIKNLIKKQTLL